MTFEEFARECREEYPTATEISLIVRPYNLQVNIIYDEPVLNGDGVQLLNGSTRVNVLIEPQHPNGRADP